MDEVPKTTTVIGGGPIGCELAQAYSRLGAEVTVVTSRLLPREEPEAGDVMLRVFESEGIKVINSRVQSIEGPGVVLILFYARTVRRYQAICSWLPLVEYPQLLEWIWKNWELN